jgi:hypothetical protein
VRSVGLGHEGMAPISDHRELLVGGRYRCVDSLGFSAPFGGDGFEVMEGDHKCATFVGFARTEPVQAVKLRSLGLRPGGCLAGIVLCYPVHFFGTGAGTANRYRTYPLSPDEMSN